MNRIGRAFNAVGGAFMVRMGWVASLGTTGARSGLPRTAAVGFLQRADGSVLIAAGGTGRAWAANLRAHPACTLTIRGRRHAYVAAAQSGADRDTALAELVASMPRNFRDASWTDVFVLRPTETQDGGVPAEAAAGPDATPREPVR